MNNDSLLCFISGLIRDEIHDKILRRIGMPALFYVSTHSRRTVNSDLSSWAAQSQHDEVVDPR